MKNFDTKLKIIVSLSLLTCLLFLGSIWQNLELQKAKVDSQRQLNNYLASHDSINVISSENETLLAQKSSMDLFYSELIQENIDLLRRLDLEKKKKAKVIIQTEIEYRDTSIYIPVTSSFENNKPSFNFKYNPTLKGKNKMFISGVLPYSISYDTCEVKSDSNRVNWKIQPSITPGVVHLEIEQKIDLVTGLFRDPQTKRLYVRASTDFPGITFNELNSINLLDDEESRKALRNSRKSFGIGMSVGFGFTAGSNGYIVRGPNLGVGLTYTPKFLQFGK